MISDAELEVLARGLETERLERKRKLSSQKTKVEEAICAFANDLPGSGQPGYVLINVDDDGSPASTPITDQLLKDLASIRSDGNILPFPRMEVERRVLHGVPIAVAKVWPSPNPPIKLRGATRVRVGPRQGIATRDEERQLAERRRHWVGMPFDQQPVYGATLDDLDLTAFQQQYLPAAIDANTLRENGRSVAEQLVALHLANQDGVPNVAGLLLLGRQPATFVKGAYVQFARFDGTDQAAPVIDRKQLEGSVPVVFDQLEQIVRLNIRTRSQFGDRPVEVNRPDYPVDALRELLRNAVMHRQYETSNAPVSFYWFADRIEINNPGGAYGRASMGVPPINDYRNPNLAAGLHLLGYVQRFNAGLTIARKACAANGNPPIEINAHPATSVVVLRPA